MKHKHSIQMMKRIVIKKLISSRHTDTPHDSIKPGQAENVLQQNFTTDFTLRAHFQIKLTNKVSKISSSCLTYFFRHKTPQESNSHRLALAEFPDEGIRLGA